MTPETLPPVLTAPEVADLLRVSTWNVYQRVRAGELPALRLGRALRFSRPAILALLETGAASDGGTGESPAGEP